MAESPWPVDSTPDDMAYVGVCAACHGIIFVCAANDASAYTRQLMQCIKRGHTLHRIPTDTVRNPEWFFCHCHRKAVPHGC